MTKSFNKRVTVNPFQSSAIGTPPAAAASNKRKACYESDESIEKKPVIIVPADQNGPAVYEWPPHNDSRSWIRIQAKWNKEERSKCKQINGCIGDSDDEPYASQDHDEAMPQATERTPSPTY
jgi:hypothetical protein